MSCYYCKEKWHGANECPLRDSKQSPETDGSEQNEGYNIEGKIVEDKEDKDLLVYIVTIWKAKKNKMMMQF